MKQVLIVEDQRMPRENMERTLSDSGRYELVASLNGADVAILKCGQQHIDLILMDIKMPRMDGLEAMIEIRKFSDIPIIIQTAYAFEVDREKCWEAGCTDFISKPIKSVTIHSILKKHLS